MKYAVHLLSKASQDADAIVRWLARRSPQGAVTWDAAFQQALDDLASHADQFGFAPDSKLRLRFRQHLFKTKSGQRYRLVFSIEVDQVYVFRVRGPGQLPLRTKDM